MVTAAAVAGEGATRLLVTFEGANRMLGVAHLGAVAGGRLKR